MVKELSYRLLSYMIDQIDDFEFILFEWGDTNHDPLVDNRLVEIECTRAVEALDSST